MRRDTAYTPYTPLASYIFGDENINSPINGRSVVILDATKAGSFRAGATSGSTWSRPNVGDRSVAFGNATTASGLGAFAHGTSVRVAGNWNVGFGSSVRIDGDNTRYNIAHGDDVQVNSSATNPTVANLAVGQSLQLLSGTRDSLGNLFCGQQNRLRETSGSVTAGINNDVLAVVYSLIGGRGSNIDNTEDCMVAGNGLTLTGVRRSVVSGISTISSGVTSNSLCIGQDNSMASGMNHGSCIGIGLRNDTTGIALFGSNGTSLNRYSNAIQLAGGITARSQGVNLSIYTQSVGTVPTQGGAANFWTTGGADYSEYLEWEDGNPQSEDRIGYFVVLGQDKISIATEPSIDVIGITSGAPGILGNSYDMNWKGANLKDAFSRDITTEVTDYDGIISFLQQRLTPDRQEPGEADVTRSQLSDVESVPRDENFIGAVSNIVPYYAQEIASYPKILANTPNPEYDPSRVYIPRSERPEWIPVCMMGQIVVRQDGTCVAGDRCSIDAQGRATSGNYWKVMKVISQGEVMIMYNALMPNVRNNKEKK